MPTAAGKGGAALRTDHAVLGEFLSRGELPERDHRQSLLDKLTTLLDLIEKAKARQQADRT